MSNDRTSRGPISQIKYHDYFALSICIDSDWVRQCSTPEDFPPPNNHRQFRRNCRKYAGRISENYEQWRQANGEESKPVCLERYLYNPISLLPLGRSGDACIVLLDDHGPVHHLTVRLSRRVEDVSIAYCLDMAHLGQVAGIDHERASAIFVEPADLFDDDCRSPHSIGHSREAVEEPTTILIHQCQRQYPFLVHTRYRMDGIASTRHFLLMQETIYRVMAKSIDTSLRRLQGLETHGSYLEEGDTAGTRCCLLDMEGPEEIGSWILCQNLTVAASIVAAFRKITYGQLFIEEPLLEKLLEDDDCLNLLVRKACDKADLKGVECVDAIRPNHIFRWTTSAAFLSPHVIQEDDYTRCGGRAVARTHSRLSPGREASWSAPLAVGGAEATGSQWQLFFIGESDVAEPLEPQPSDHAAPLPAEELVPTRNVLKEWKRRVTDIIDKASDQADTTVPASSGYLSMFLELQVPVLRTDRPLRHHAILRRVLNKVHNRLCPDTESADSNHLPLSFMEMHDREKSAGLPVKLRETLESLFQLYFAVLCDPQRFDLVLDLYDVFATLHRLITRWLPTDLDARTMRWEDRRRILDGNGVTQLGAIASALENALYHRIAKIFPVSNPLDMAVDFRGGLQQAILAASAPLLASVGLFRRCVVEPFLESTREQMDSRSTIGVTCRISLTTGLDCCPIRLGHECVGTPQLTFYEMDVPHVLHTASCAEYYNETGHLVFRNLFRSDAPEGYRCEAFARLWTLASSGNREDRERFESLYKQIDELFATFFGHVFVFGMDRLAPMLNYVAAFSRSTASIGQEDDHGWIEKDTIARFTDVVCTFSMIWMLLPDEDENDPQRIEQWLGTEPDLPELGDAESIFDHVLELVGPYYPEYRRLWKTEPFASQSLRYAHCAFREQYSRVRDYLPWIFKTVGQLYSEYLARCNVPDELTKADFVVKKIGESLESGQPLIRCLLPIRVDASRGRDPDAVERESRDPFVDIQFVISNVLHRYIRKIVESQSRPSRVVLKRSKEGDRIDYSHVPGEPEHWWEFQIDRGAESLFCPVPDARRTRIRRQITARKIFRDIASTLQGRRLYRIVYDTLS